MQGRLPIRVELNPLTPEDFIRILTEPNASITEQYRELLKTEGVTLTFSTDGLRKIAEIAWSVNEKTENIGARRLHTVMERLLEDISFDAADLGADAVRRSIVIDATYVEQHLGKLAQDEDLSRFIL